VRVFQPTRKGPRGATVPYRLWYCEFKQGERVRRMPGFTDRGETEALGRKLERLAMPRAATEGPDRELARYVERLPDRMREKLAGWGILDARTFAGTYSLSELLDRFEESLRSAGRTEKHVGHVLGRARRAFEACGFRTWSDLDSMRLAVHLRTERERGLSVKTSNHALAACQEFTRWAVQHSFAGSNPLLILRPLNAKTDPRRERRALSFEDELPRLLLAAVHGPTYRGVSGPLRGLVYKLAAESGLRVAELCSLRVRDFEDLAGARPTVTVRAAAAKNRRERTLPLRLETAREAAGFLAGRLPQALALALPSSFKGKATCWLRFDLERAGLPYVDESGRIADMHALRASMISGLVRAGADARTVQSLARHSTAEMTLSIYAKLGRDSERDALALLPKLPSVETPIDAACATGTDDMPDSMASSVAFSSSSTVSPRLVSTPHNAEEHREEAVASAEGGGGGGNRTRVPEGTGPGRLRA
jgi:integrase